MHSETEDLAIYTDLYLGLMHSETEDLAISTDLYLV